jgi:hypothetical protein
LTPAQWARIRQIFEDAVEQPQPARARYVAAQCGEDVTLLREVKSLLANHEQSGDFLNEPVVDIASSLSAMDDLTGEFPRFAALGPYKLERRIGRGGMGSVWLASRSDHAYERKVAIKMVKLGMDTTEILRQFQRERELLAIAGRGIDSGRRAVPRHGVCRGHTDRSIHRAPEVFGDAAAAIVPASVRGSALCASELGRASRSEAWQYSGVRNRRAEASRFRYRKAAAPGTGRGNAAGTPRDDARLRKS